MKYTISVVECNGSRLIPLILRMRMGVGLVIAALVCVYEMWFVLAGLKVLAPWDAGFKAWALRTV